MLQGQYIERKKNCWKCPSMAWVHIMTAANQDFIRYVKSRIDDCTTIRQAESAANQVLTLLITYQDLPSFSEIMPCLNWSSELEKL